MSAIREPHLRLMLAGRLTDLRAERGNPQSQVAKAAGMSQPALSNYEAGLREPPLWALLRLCRFYGVAVCEVVTGDDLGKP